MDENFEVNELELENTSQVPAVDPQPEEPLPDLSSFDTSGPIGGQRQRQR